MKFMITCIMALAIATASFADGPGNNDCPKKNHSSSVRPKQNRAAVKSQKKSTAARSEKKLRRVENANPQHAGYPKADAKGNFPSHYNKHTYYL